MSKKFLDWIETKDTKDKTVLKIDTETNQQAYNKLFSNYYMRDFPDVVNTSVFFERRK